MRHFRLTPRVIKHECWLKGRAYYPVCPPSEDTPELAAMGRRLVFYNNSQGFGRAGLLTARKGELQAGWVVGILL